MIDSLSLAAAAIRIFQPFLGDLEHGEWRCQCSDTLLDLAVQAQ